MKLKIDPEFANLSIPLTESELNDLNSELSSSGCQSPICIWDDLIIDGHKRYIICKKNNIPFTTQKYTFANRYEAIIWICENNGYIFGNTQNEFKKYQIGKHYEAANVLSCVLNGKSQPPRYNHKIALELSAIYNVVPNTIYKYGTYTQCVDALNQKEPEIVKKILSGRLKISQTNIVELARLPKNEIKRINTNINNSALEQISFSDMRHEMNSRRYMDYSPPSRKKAKEPSAINVAIKQMPEYDPDAEISSLTLTIPSWVSSMQRARTNANFSLVSVNARNNLKQKLAALVIAVDEILAAIEEES